jgi:hypothetical protein
MHRPLVSALEVAGEGLMTPEKRALLATTGDRLRTIEADLGSLMLEARLGDPKLAYRVRGYVNAARRALLSAVGELEKHHADR